MAHLPDEAMAHAHMQACADARRSRASRRLFILAALGLPSGLSNPAVAAPSEVQIVQQAELNFGTFIVLGAGSRSVSASGAVSDINVVPLEDGAMPSPARFTIVYDRGSNSRKIVDVELEIVLTQPAPVRVNGVEGQLSGFETDLPDASRIQPGQAIRITLPNCASRTCSRSFSLGARIEVTQQFGGAELAVSIPFDVTLISEG